MWRPRASAYFLQCVLRADQLLQAAKALLWRGYLLYRQPASPLPSSLNDVLCPCRDLDEAQAAADEARHEVVQADAAQATQAEHLGQELTRCMLSCSSS